MIKRIIACCSYDYLNEWLADEYIGDDIIINIETLANGTYCIWYRV